MRVNGLGFAAAIGKANAIYFHKVYYYNRLYGILEREDILQISGTTNADTAVLIMKRLP